MNEIMRALLGPCGDWVMGLSFARAVVAQRSIRRRHGVRLRLLTLLGFFAFFAVLPGGFVVLEGYPRLYQGLLAVLGARTIGCGTAIGFWLILRTLGLASDGEA